MPRNRSEDEGSPQGAWVNDDRFGNRLDQTIPMGKPFLLLGAVISDDVIETTFGDAEKTEMLVRNVNDNHEPYGPAFVVNAIQSAIVEKMKALTDGDLPMIVKWDMIASKKRNRPVMVISKIGAPGETGLDLFEKFGVTADATSDDMAGFGTVS